MERWCFPGAPDLHDQARDRLSVHSRDMLTWLKISQRGAHGGSVLEGLPPVVLSIALNSTASAGWLQLNFATSRLPPTWTRVTRRSQHICAHCSEHMPTSATITLYRTNRGRCLQQSGVLQSERRISVVLCMPARGASRRQQPRVAGCKLP